MKLKHAIQSLHLKMRKDPEQWKGEYVYEIGCLTIFVLAVIGMIALYFAVNREPDEKVAVGYVIAHVSELQDEIAELGYTARVACTYQDLDAFAQKTEQSAHEEGEQAAQDSEERLGYAGRGILILSNGQEEYRFDIGFDRYLCMLDSGVRFSMTKVDDTEILGRKKWWGAYPIEVSVYGEEIKEKYQASPWCQYQIDFETFFWVHGDEYFDNKQIKQYISAEEMRQIYECGIALQQQLVELYHQKKQ